MEESGGDDREGRDEISLLAEELIQLSVKGSMVEPNSKPTLICTVWTGKLYNPESFRAQMKSIWKTRKKFEIQRLSAQNQSGCSETITSRMGYGIADCTQNIPARKSKISIDPPYTLALKAESKLVGKESMKFHAMMKKVGVQSSYTGDKLGMVEGSREIKGEYNEFWGVQENSELMVGEGKLNE
ncbi:hypothetical protein GOBAR_DD30912 [Gossypium barbadense]|nr:hypothetical protein GOBAR_DD30912 [Gossypium barbadense]